MPQAHRAKKPPGADAATLAALSQLARKGAYAAPMDAPPGASGAFGVFRSGDTSSPAVAVLPADTVAHLCRRAWLAADAQTGRYRLTPAGIGELRRAKSAPAGSAKTHTAPPARQAKRAAKRQLAAERPAQESPLVWLRRRKDKDGQPLITEPQFNAGERLAADFWHAQMSPRVTANWSAVGRRPTHAAVGTRRRRRSQGQRRGGAHARASGARRGRPRACRHPRRCVLPRCRPGAGRAEPGLAAAGRQGRAAARAHAARPALRPAGARAAAWRAATCAIGAMRTTGRAWMPGRPSARVRRRRARARRCGCAPPWRRSRSSAAVSDAPSAPARRTARGRRGA